MIKQDFEQNVGDIAKALSNLEKEAYYEYWTCGVPVL